MMFYEWINEDHNMYTLYLRYSYSVRFNAIDIMLSLPGASHS